MLSFPLHPQLPACPVHLSALPTHQERQGKGTGWDLEPSEPGGPIAWEAAFPNTLILLSSTHWTLCHQFLISLRLLQVPPDVLLCLLAVLWDIW